MKIAITAIGTRGDLQPYIALALALKKAGYEVQIVSAKNEALFVGSYGLAFFALDVDIKEIMEGGAVDGMAKGNNPFKFIKSHLRGARLLKNLMVRTQGEIAYACKDADLIIFHPGMPLGFFLAKEQNKKAILATPFPLVQTKDYPSILFYSWPGFGSYYNLFTHFIFDKVFWAFTRSPIREYWSKNIKTKMDFNRSAVKQQISSGQPLLNGYSQHLFKRPGEWPKNIHTTGSWFLETTADFLPPPDLDNFINDGETPVYIGFGSMNAAGDFNKALALITKALQITKQRAIVGLGCTKDSYGKPIPGNIFLVDNVPHTWLFPKMKILIHHGGAGTTATGLRAGKPTIIIPHNADQPAWGQRIFEIGVGSKPIRKSKLTAQKLAEAILFSQSPVIMAKAERLGHQLRAEHGVEKAVQIIENFMNK